MYLDNEIQSIFKKIKSDQKRQDYRQKAGTKSLQRKRKQKVATEQKTVGSFCNDKQSKSEVFIKITNEVSIFL
jgi:hypothetical protein